MSITLKHDESVEQFHNSFGITNAYSPVSELNDKDLKLRFDLMKEENEEYLDAAKKGDLIEIATLRRYVVYPMRYYP